MKAVSFKRKVVKPMFKAFIDGKALKFSGDEATAKAAEGQHALTWVVLGDSGDSYTIEIAAPAESKFKHTATLDSDRKDAGLHWFTVAAE